MRKLKILFECPRYYPTKGGIQISMYNLAKKLIKEGHKVHVLCKKYPKGFEEYNHKEYIEGVKIIKFEGKELPRYLEFLRYTIRKKEFEKEIFKLSKKEKYDVIVSRYFYFVEPTKKAFPNTPIIYWHPSIMYLATKKYSKNTSSFIEKIIFRYLSIQTFFIEKKAVKLADLVVVRSKVMEKIDINKFGIQKNKIRIIKQGIYLNKFKKRKKDKKLIKKFNLEGKKVVLTVSRLKPDKNTSGLIRVFSKIKDKNSVLLIVGGGIGQGMEREYLEELTKKLKIQKRVIFVGEVSDTHKYYNLADVFVLASEQEGFPNVFLEAMASGVPIIGFHSKFPKITIPTEEIVKNNSIGFAVKNEKEMIEKIELLLKNKNLREKMGKLSRKEALNYSWDKVYQQFIKIIKELK